MKKYLNLLPLVAFPFLFFPVSMLLWAFVNTGNLSIFDNVSEIAILIIIGILFLIPIVLSIVGAISTAKKIKLDEIALSNASRVTLIIKGCTTFALSVNCVLMALSCLLGIWGLGMILFLLFVNGWTLLCTGIISCGFIRRLRDEEILPKKHSVLRYILSFIMYFDTIQAVLLFIRYKNKHYKITEKIGNIAVSEIKKKDEVTT